GRMADDRSTSFEDSLKRLEQIVKALETDDTDLERAVALYKEGRELVGRCETLLKTAQQSIDGVNQPARPAEGALDDDEFPA
ncbi:MAG: exodeoxyribonuclease small subunit, partial [Candidatus Eremiobacteraeota bacterium]|nr:exodeoxyribonuclease small subunit [Candidatus Eremiobacteraeota bacterium]